MVSGATGANVGCVMGEGSASMVGVTGGSSWVAVGAQDGVAAGDRVSAGESCKVERAVTRPEATAVNDAANTKITTSETAFCARVRTGKPALIVMM